jgi:hypothetical protein
MRSAISRWIAVLVTAKRILVRGDRPLRSEQRADLRGIEGHALPFARHFDHHIEARGLVVRDAEADPVAVDPRGDFEVRIRWFEASGRMVVHEHFASLREAGERQDAPHITSRDWPRARDDSVVVDLAGEAHLVPERERDRGAHRLRRVPSDAISGGGAPGHVLSGFFLAAGKSTLFRISR